MTKGFIIPTDSPLGVDHSNWETANQDLKYRRMNVENGDPNARWRTRESLERAKGCP